MTSTPVATVIMIKKMPPVHTVGPIITRLAMQDHILANLRVKAGNNQQPRVSLLTSRGRVFEVDSEKEKLD